MTTSIQDVLEDGLEDDVVALARHLKGCADLAWDACSVAGAKGDDLTAAYQRGRAHALCEVLGDQEALGFLGIFDPPKDPAPSSLDNAISKVMTASGEPMTAIEVTDAIHERWPGSWPLVSWLDIHQSMQCMFGPATMRRD